MSWTLTHDLDEYVAAAGDFPRSRPVQHTIHLVAVETLRSAGMSAFGDTLPLSGAVTASVSRAALDAGAADVVLFTDLANPTSNALYRRLGYRPVEDRLALGFGC